VNERDKRNEVTIIEVIETEDDERDDAIGIILKVIEWQKSELRRRNGRT
jgi:hypothetical protein